MQSTHIPPKTQPMPAAFALNKDLQFRLAALAEASSQQPEQLIEKAVREYVERQEYRNAQALDAVCDQRLGHLRGAVPVGVGFYRRAYHNAAANRLPDMIDIPYQAVKINRKARRPDAIRVDSRIFGIVCIIHIKHI